jgi:hypothetical protein
MALFTSSRIRIRPKSLLRLRKKGKRISVYVPINYGLRDHNSLTRLHVSTDLKIMITGLISSKKAKK